MIKHFNFSPVFLCICVWFALVQPLHAAVIEFITLKSAPSFRAGLPWLNVARPLTLHELRGKFVLLDFWSYSSVNCQNALPELKQLETLYPKELLVVGVHSAKFQNERQTKNVREAVMRYNITHPVINDYQLRMWRDYDVSVWPTVVLIDPEGRIVFKQSGEGFLEPVGKILEARLSVLRSRMNTRKLPLLLEKNKEPRRGRELKFPGAVAVADGSLVISDSGHNRVLVADEEGWIKDTIGQGDAGYQDGPFETALFSDPQGLVFRDGVLYIADRANNVVRRADLKSRTVTTVAGTGQKGALRLAKGLGREVALNAPRGLALDQDNLYIAMAGFHQIWVLDLPGDKIQVFAGSGIENLVDGPLLRSAFAQPSGIAVMEGTVYCADAQTSAVRFVAPDKPAMVKTLIGQGAFIFGDRDGPLAVARIQQPLGIAAYREGELVLADTFNHKIKLINAGNKTITLLAGTGQAGYRDGSLGEAMFNEPSGVAVNRDKIFVADTNNHQVRVIDPGRQEVRTLVLSEKEGGKKSRPDSSTFTGERIRIKKPLATNVRQLALSVDLPVGCRILYSARPYVRIFTDQGNFDRVYDIYDSDSFFNISHTFLPGPLHAEVMLYYCYQGSKDVCLIKNLLYTVQVKERARTESLGLNLKVRPDYPQE